MSRWLLEWGADDVVNAIPIEDHRDHLLSGRCWCGPTLDDDVLVHSGKELSNATRRIMCRQRRETECETPDGCAGGIDCRLGDLGRFHRITD